MAARVHCVVRGTLWLQVVRASRTCRKARTRHGTSNSCVTGATTVTSSVRSEFDIRGDHRAECVDSPGQQWCTLAGYSRLLDDAL
ncbi:hypothetical protein NDU88_001306 [Pleurodeles waltl]|uniref:Secreted protein n=1 Tax=Pleurodeles waltl TaxID=8319 RepID=A0AAV7SC85_PLEWA|nr:hypothetical protein NDU88_001306 [Pleurodeles waltl]